MAPVMRADQKPRLLETGSEPEFFITTIAKFETMTNGMIRIYLATQKGNCLRLEYTAVVACADLADMGRACLHMAAECHNAQMDQSAALH